MGLMLFTSSRKFLGGHLANRVFPSVSLFSGSGTPVRYMLELLILSSKLPTAVSCFLSLYFSLCFVSFSQFHILVLFDLLK